MPAQPTVADEQRSAFGHRAGLQSWGAVLIAVTATLAGFAIEAGSDNSELGNTFAACYALGCIAAVLLVRRSSIFTAVVQPPLLLFVAVPLAYFILHGSAFGGLKDIAINCGYPLIERFPLMLFTSAAVLLIGMIRWFLAMAPNPQSATVESAAAGLPTQPSRFAGWSATLSSMFARSGAREAVRRPAKPRHGADRAPAGRRPGPDRRPNDPAPARSRRPRPPLEGFDDAPPRRRQTPSRSARNSEPPLDQPRRRPRADREPGRTPPPPRREPRERRDDRGQYPPRPARTGRFETSETGRGYPSRAPYPPYENPRRPPYENPRRPPSESPRRPSSGTHHPVSRVRYRESGPTDADDLDGYRNRPGR